MSPPIDTDEAIEALTELLALNPGIAWIDALVVDMNGVVRGKRYPREDAHKLCVSGMQFPISTYFLDVTGDCMDPLGRGVSDGDPDATAWPVVETFAAVTWGERPGGQVLMALHGPDGVNPLDPRATAARALEALTRQGLHPHCAFELEFYLLEGDHDGAPRRADGPGQVYRMEDLDRYEPVLDDIGAACAAQGIPASVITSEFSAGQFEINLRHDANALRAADHAVMFKRLVGAVARNHQLRATFMAKPFLDLTGSGTHVHLSLCDEHGDNLFHDRHDKGPVRLSHAMAGVLQDLPQSMALYAPNINSYRRFVANHFVPVNCSWARNNRSVAVRIPDGPASARRFEFRLPGADANPYLVLAGLLAGVSRGLREGLSPGPEATGNASREPDPELPLDLTTALARLSGSRVLKDALGEPFVHMYAEFKRLEALKFHDQIGAREYAWYL